MSSPLKVALIGNPNTGKTSIFNALTGLRQKVGNYPGITVEKKTGACFFGPDLNAAIYDLPGTYSLNTTSLDESVAVEILLNRRDPDFPDVVVVIADVENLKRNLLLFTQIKDLGLRTILAINMSDRMKRLGIEIDVPSLESSLDTRIALLSSRNDTGIEDLKVILSDYKSISDQPSLDITDIDKAYFENLKTTFPRIDAYKLWLAITQDVNFMPIEKKVIPDRSAFSTKSKSELQKMQHRETVLRYKYINNALKEGYQKDLSKADGIQGVLDRIFTHKIFGYLIFFVILFTMFQAIFDFSSYPMDAIDNFFASASEWIKATLPSGVLTDLLAEGIVAGIGGVVIFIPQIAFLFLFISILEESGYMSRVVFLMDRIMKPFGLSGKSVVPLMSGMACAIPAVMATRTIENWKERLITIMVVPFTTCSARLPVYLIIIALVIPEGRFLGLGYQALVLTGLYLLGFLAAVVAAAILNRGLNIERRSFFMIEMPTFKPPQFRNVAITVFEKTKSFVLEAGKIILALSVVIWFLGSNGYSDSFKNAEAEVIQQIQQQGLNLSDEELSQKISSYKLEHSYIGVLGKIIEPVVKPLGYDWKIGIAVITSFAAREVFVGTLATIYSVGEESESTIVGRMALETDELGKPIFNLASGVSILLFYAFAMQCMSTIAVVRKETNSWKWPMIQLGYMTLLAYLSALIAYQTLI
ncbi:MAG: ferrous iron transport protein B [Flavobacteriaceae bacterium]|nr:ferrous iron transport protein B [Flavobacteriaceae bacterium]